MITFITDAPNWHNIISNGLFYSTMITGIIVLFSLDMPEIVEGEHLVNIITYIGVFTLIIFFATFVALLWGPILLLILVGCMLYGMKVLIYKRKR